MASTDQTEQGFKDFKYLPQNKSWTSVHDRYVREDVLGEGTYGIVFRAQNVKTGQRVAMKRSRLDLYADEGVPATAVRELALLRDLSDHPNVVQLHEISCNSSRLYMVCECLDYDLKKYLKAHNRKIPYEEVKSIFYQTLKGISWCHGHRVIHRDLKPHNILLNKNASTVKLADFGLARAAHAPGKTVTHEVITLWYRPPELLMGGSNYSDAVDIWSMGCILGELLSGQPMFMGDCEVDTLFKIFKVLGTPTLDEWPGIVELPESMERDQWPKFRANKETAFGNLREELDDNGVELLSQMLVYDPDKRITALEALQHPWFADVRTPRRSKHVRLKVLPSASRKNANFNAARETAQSSEHNGICGPDKSDGVPNQMTEQPQAQQSPIQRNLFIPPEYFNKVSASRRDDSLNSTRASSTMSMSERLLHNAGERGLEYEQPCKRANVSGIY